MGKTFEALERAEKEFQKPKYDTAVEFDEKNLLTFESQQKTFDPSDDWNDLQNKLLSRYSNPPIQTLLFTGTAHGVGVTSTVLKFAKSLVKASDHRVLIIETNLRTPFLQRLFTPKSLKDPAQGLPDDGLKIFKFKKVGQGDLFAFTFGRNNSDGVDYLETKRFQAMIETSKKKFDYIILDAAPIGSCSESQAICSKVDGVLLVIEAGQTRRQVAQRAKKELADAGGRLLGVVLNKRKYYIPNWIYKRL